MSLDLSLFGGVLLSPQAQSAVTSTHFAAATRYVSAANLAIALPIATPLRLLQGAWEVPPMLDETGRQIWTYGFDVDGTTYTVRLEGVPQTSAIEWYLFASNQELGLGEFLWVEGVSDLDNRAGRWLFRQPHGTEVKVTAEWHFSELREVELHFVQQDRQSAYYGSTLVYRQAPGPQGAIASILFQNFEGQTAEIRWNVISHDGQIAASDYQDGQLGCWDTQLQDVPCE